MLKLHEAAAIMDRRRGRDQPVPFSLTYLTHDSRRGGSGQVRILHKATLSKALARHVLHSCRARGERPTIDVQPQGIAHKVRVHFDLMLTINNQPIA